MELKAALIFATSLGVSPALADWQYVKWGMTPAQAIAASKGELKPATTDGKNIVCAFTDQTVVGLAPQKKLGSMTAEITLCANSSGRVSSVVVRPFAPDNNVISLKAALQAQYGRPIEDSGPRDISTTVWRDDKTKNLVRLLGVVGTGKIEYRGAPSGL